MKNIFLKAAGVLLISGFCSGNAQAIGTCNTLVLSDNFSSSTGWTFADPATGGNGKYWWSIATNTMRFDKTDATTCPDVRGVSCGREIRAYKSLTTTLNNASWRAEMKFRISDGNGPAHVLLGVTAGTLHYQGTIAGGTAWSCTASNNNSGFLSTNQDGIFASLVNFGGGDPGSYTDRPHTPATWKIYGHAKNNSSSMSAGCSPCVNWAAGIELPALNTDYWLRLERIDGTTCRISVFSNSGMTAHIPGSPQCFTIEPDIVNLNTVQMGSFISSSYRRSLTGLADDLNIWNDCNDNLFSPQFSLTPTFTPGSAYFTMYATPVTGSSNANIAAAPGYGYWWRVEEVTDATGTTTVPGTAMENPSAWWNTYPTNPFKTYLQCPPGTPPTTYGTFCTGHYYKITRGVWGPCDPWTGYTYVIYGDALAMSLGNDPFVVVSQNFIDMNDAPESLSLPQHQSSVTEEQELTVYPNPSASGVFKITLNNLTASNQLIQVYNANGAVIYSERVTENEIILDLSKLENGIYLVAVNDESGTRSCKIIIQK